MLTVNSWINCAAKGNLIVLKENLQVYCGQQDENGNTALMTAAQHGHLQCVKFLMQYELDIVNNKQETAQDIAQKHNQHEIANYLADAKSPGTEAYQQANKAKWFEAAETNDIEFLKQNYRFYIKSRDLRPGKQKQTGLMAAATNGAIDAVKLLKKQEQGMRDGKGKTALMYAAENSQVQAVNELYQGNIDENESVEGQNEEKQDIDQQENNQTPENVEENIQPSSHKSECMSEHYSYKTDTQASSRTGNTKKVVQLDVGVEVGMKDDYDWCALMYAVDANCLDATRILCQNSTELANKNVFNIGALEIANQRNLNNIKELLLSVKN